MRLTDAKQQTLLEWAARKLNIGGWPADSFALGVLEDREAQKPLLRACLIFNAFHGKSCRVHIASDGSRKWATRDILTRLAAYIHLQRDVIRLATTISVNNLPAQIAAMKIGFQIQGRDRCGADDGSDGILFSILRDENPWLKEQQNG